MRIVRRSNTWGKACSADVEASDGFEVQQYHDSRGQATLLAGGQATVLGRGQATPVTAPTYLRPQQLVASVTPHSVIVAWYPSLPSFQLSHRANSPP